MLEVDFVTMADDRLAPQVSAMMRELYSEDEPASAPDPGRFPLTITYLLANPSHGRIVLFMQGSILSGYALLIPYWSNEFGGVLLFIDELFVMPGARNRGIGHRFFEIVASEKPFDAVALAVEVSPANRRARALYESLGFELRNHAVLTKRFPASNNPG